MQNVLSVLCRQPCSSLSVRPNAWLQVCDSRSIPNSLPTHPSLPNPLLGALSPLSSLSLPGSNGNVRSGATEGLCSALGAMLSFHQKQQKSARQSMFWVFSEKEPAEAVAAHEASARAEVRRRSTMPQATATPSAWTCFSRPAPRRRAPAAPRVASAGFGAGGGVLSFKGQEGVERCRKQGVPSSPCKESRALEFRTAVLQIPCTGFCRHVVVPSEQFLSWAFVHFIV